MKTISIPKPDDWHLHLRDTPYLEAVVAHTASQFARAIIMPNLSPPVRTRDDALAYRDRILAALPAGSRFDPLMTLYLTNNTSPDDIRAACDSEFIHGAKLYPAGATTNSDAGVTDIGAMAPVFDAMQRHGLVLQVHGEVTDPAIDVFDREKAFIDQRLAAIHRDFPELRIVFEHITTSDAIEFVRDASDRVAATITAHHLIINRNALFQGGIRPHHYCLPVAKRERHRKALVEAAASGNSKFFCGTDSAPHSRNAKESACGCAGIYSAYSAVELYAEAFEQDAELTHFEAFMSQSGPAFYGLPVNEERIVLERRDWQLPETLPYPDSPLIPFRAGETLRWKLLEDG